MYDKYHEFKKIPTSKLTSKICNTYIKNDPKIIVFVPNYLINNETFDIILEKEPFLLTKIPKELIDEEKLSNAILEKPTLITYFPSTILTEEFCKKLVTKNPLLIRYMTKDILTTGIVDIPVHYYIDSTTILQEIFNSIPGEFLSKETLEEIISHNIKTTRVIPYHKLNRATRDYIVDLILNKNKEYAEKYIPKKYLPVGSVKEVIKEKSIEEKELELNILKELTTILTSGGTVEKISKKYNVSVDKINSIIEKQQTENPEFYNAIKNKLLSNQTTWLINMENDYHTLENIIFSLNIENETQLSREQKIKFAYLYNRLCKNTLEDIYSYINRIQNINERSPVLKAFYNKILKYNYLKVDYITIPDKKAIMFNNRWLKPFNVNEYFRIKDGLPTAKNMYLEHEITVNVVNQVISILNEYNIPLNDLIVKEGIREYYNNQLEDYISVLKSYERELENKTKK